MTPDERRTMETEAREFDLIERELLKAETAARNQARARMITGALKEARLIGEALLNNPVQANYVRYRLAVVHVSKVLDVPFSQAVAEIRSYK